MAFCPASKSGRQSQSQLSNPITNLLSPLAATQFCWECHHCNRNGLFILFPFQCIECYQRSDTHLPANMSHVRNYTAFGLLRLCQIIQATFGLLRLCQVIQALCAGPIVLFVLPTFCLNFTLSGSSLKNDIFRIIKAFHKLKHFCLALLETLLYRALQGHPTSFYYHGTQGFFHAMHLTKIIVHLVDICQCLVCYLLEMTILKSWCAQLADERCLSRSSLETDIDYDTISKTVIDYDTISKTDIDYHPISDSFCF